MQHTVEDLSPVKKKVAVTVSASEVDDVLNRATAQYRARVALPGFRKGKAPLPMVEKRFKEEIYGDAVNELVNANISEILRELDVEPLGNLNFEETEAPLVRSQEFTYAFSFELMPQIDVPQYEGIGVEEEDVVVKDDEIDEVIERVRKGMAEKIPSEEVRLPQDDDIMLMDFAGFDENGEAVPGVDGKDFQVAIGEGQVIPDFEALVKTLKPGEEGEGQVTFPEDYGHKPLAGKTVTMKITMRAMLTRKLPEVDDDFAKKAGGFETVQAMRDSIRETYERNRKDMAKAKAQSLLLEGLLEKVNFPLPEGMVEQYTNNILHGKFEEMSRTGADMSSFQEGDFEKMKEEAKTEAEKFAKTQLFLLTVAKQEELEATQQDITMALRQVAARNRRDFKEVQEHYAKNNLLPALRDRVLADKAMDVIYAKASPEDAEESAKKTAAKAKKAEKNEDAAPAGNAE